MNFDPIVPDPFLAPALCNRSRRRNLLITVLLVAGFSWIASAVQSGLAPVEIVQVICSDFRTAIGASPIPDCPAHIVPAPQWPLWRDVYSYYAIVVMLATPILVGYQSAGIRRVLGDMSAHGALRPNNATALDFVNREIRLANRFYQQVRKYVWLVALLPALAMVGMMAVQAYGGVFIAMQPPQFGDSASLGHESYRNWWLNPVVSPVGAAVYFVAGTVGMYVVTSQNIIGLRLIWTFWKCRKEATLCADPINVDGYFGWCPVRTIYRAALLELTLHGLGLGLVGLMMPPAIGWLPLGFASIQWLLVMPIYIAFPFVFARYNVQKFKDSEIAYLQQLADRRMSSGGGTQVIQDIETISNRIAGVHSIPRVPFFRAKDGAVLAVSLIADSAAVSILVLNLLTWSR